MGATVSTNLKGSHSNLNSFRNNGLFIRKYSAGRTPKLKENLFSRLNPLRDPNQSILPILDQWVEEGNKVKEFEFHRIIREFRGKKRYSHALQISEWLGSKGDSRVSSGIHAIQLDLIGVVRGVDAAESYFDNLSNQEKNDKTYCALLSCYVREGLVDKSLAHVEKMKEIGFVSSALVYSNLMCLYAHTGQLEKIPDVLTEMKKNSISPSNFSYRVCLNSYGERSDFDSMEKLLEEMESQPYISVDWNTYSNVANFYVKAGLKEKALIVLKKLEEKLDKDALGYNHLISHYAHLGNKDEVMRLWGVHKAVCKKQINRDYITLLGSLVKLGELEESEALLKEWESSCYTYDFRVPNILLIGYCQKGLVEKAEATLRNIIKAGKSPTPNSWSIIALGYLDSENLGKCFECMKEALVLQAQSPGWRPKPRLVSGILKWLGDNGEVEEVEAFVRLLRQVVPVNREMYHALMKAKIRAGEEVDGILESMRSDEIAEDDETEKVLALDMRKLKN